MKKLRGAVIGVGYLGRFHAQKYSTLNEQVNLVGVCDARPESAKSVAQELKTESFSNPKELIGKIDVATIATTTTTHFEVASLLIENGIHVLIEKPMTATAEQAEKIVRLAEKKGVVVQVGHIERFNPAFLELQKQLAKPVYFESERLAPFKPRALDVDVVTDLMIHDIDLMLTVMNEDVASVKASGSRVLTETFDTATAIFTLKSGRKASLHVNRVYPHAVRNIAVFEDKKHIFADLGQLQLTTVARNIPNIYDATPAEQTVVPIAKHDAMLVETKAFLDAVNGKASVPVSAADGLRSIKVMETVLNELRK